MLVANLEAADGGAAIVHGNERVVRARLSDARFFWETDKKVRLEDRLEKLKSITFHEKLGTQFERVERIARLARELAPLVGADADKAEIAARLAKADLVTEMVGEFPELQGLMGRYYAQAEGLDPEIAAAIEEHYKPVGPSDRIPTAPVSIAVALADKIDTLVGFWAIDEKPTGSKDPYALRRAALGVVRIVLENGLRVRLWKLLDQVRSWRPGYVVGRISNLSVINPAPTFDLLAFLIDRLKVQLREQGARHDLVDAALGAGLPPPLRGRVGVGGGAESSGASEVAPSAPSGTTPTPDPSPQGGGEKSAASPLPGGERSTGEAGRVRGLEPVSDADEGPHPALRADLSPQGRGEGRSPSSRNDDLVLIVRRVEALGRLLESEDGKNLLAGYKRAANILRAEEKKDGAGAFEAEPDVGLLTETAEIDLSKALDIAAGAAAQAVAAEDFGLATAALAKLRPEVDAFFDQVTVNAPDPALRANRLKLLARLRRATRAVADFDRIEG